MRERVFAHVSTRLRKEAFPLPCPAVTQNSAFQKITRGVFPKSPLVFDDAPQVSKFASFFPCNGLYFSNRFSTFAIERHSDLRSPFSRKALCHAFPTLSAFDDTHDASPLWHGACRQLLSHLVSRTKKGQCTRTCGNVCAVL